jgi:predicted site-specific integrase-resolvase
LKGPSITHSVVERQDNLTLFGFRNLETLLELQDRTIEVFNLSENDREELPADLVSIVSSFAARLYRQRRTKRKTQAIVKQVKAEIEQELPSSAAPDHRDREDVKAAPPSSDYRA